MIILNWLFQDEPLFQALSSNLASIITRKDDRFITFGWCTLVRKLVEFETYMNKYSIHGNDMIICYFVWPIVLPLFSRKVQKLKLTYSLLQIKK